MVLHDINNTTFTHLFYTWRYLYTNENIHEINPVYRGFMIYYTGKFWEVITMAYGVYYRDKGDKIYRRACDVVIATRGRFKGGEILKDCRFDTLEEAYKKAEYYEKLGCEIQIKEVK